MHINLVDINDNAPYFEAKSYSGSVFETAAHGDSVLTVSISVSFWVAKESKNCTQTHRVVS